MDEAHREAALRQVAINLVRARLTARAGQWRWSSAAAKNGAGNNQGGIARVTDTLTLLHDAKKVLLRYGETG